MVVDPEQGFKYLLVEMKNREEKDNGTGAGMGMGMGVGVGVGVSGGVTVGMGMSLGMGMEGMVKIFLEVQDLHHKYHCLLRPADRDKGELFTPSPLGYDDRVKMEVNVQVCVLGCVCVCVCIRVCV